MPLTRRQFLKGLGAAFGGLGLSATGYERLVPYIQQPENIIPGVSTWYATSCRECPAGCAMVVRNLQSRVVKCEGNPRHPISHGTLCARGQAALHGLYDPDRIKGPMRRNGRGSLARVEWDEAIEAVGELIGRRGRIAMISDLQAGSLAELMRAWIEALGSRRMVVYEPINYESVRAAAGGVAPWFDIARCDYLLSFAADFLETWLSPVEYAGHFATMREVRNGTRGRFAYVGPRVSMTAANADIRIIVPPGTEAEVAKAIMGEGLPADELARRHGLDAGDLSRVIEGFRAANAPLALPGGDTNTARAAMQLNNAAGSPLVYRARPHAVTQIATRQEMADMVSSMEAGEVDVLIVPGANPVYSLPESARFAEALRRVPNVISLSSFMDETTTHAHWVLPSSTPLESWGDYAPYPGVVNLMQPTMGLVFDTRHTGDILIALARKAGVKPAEAFGAQTYYAYLRRRWGFPLPPGDGPDASAPEWESLLQEGGRWSEARFAPAPSPPPGSMEIAGTWPEPVTPTNASAGGDGNPLEVRLHAYPHPYLYDGRGANRRWLQETPTPVIKAVWSSWAELHPSTAEVLGIATDDLVSIDHDGVRIEAPAYVWPGVAPGTVAVPIGQGHTAYGGFAEGVGANVLPLLDEENPRVKIAAAGGAKWAARIKGSTDEHGRGIVRTVRLGEEPEREHIALPLKAGYGPADLHRGHEHGQHRWAMTIDLDRCIGCNACVTACYAENNIGVVGPEGAWRRREMSWVRIDRYIDWSRTFAPILFQPMLCQHCDAAPCEPVCPVYAAAHSEEGVNMQVYNRCVGTRYCSNNCPYKVRRFNWFDYEWPAPLNWQLNPDVTVRCRGVMEKCTFCIQRIRGVEILAARGGRPVREGEITPACAQTCPTQAFTFGDLADPNSRVSRTIRENPRAYQVLQELNTKTAVIYLKKVVES